MMVPKISRNRVNIIVQLFRVLVFLQSVNLLAAAPSIDPALSTEATSEKSSTAPLLTSSSVTVTEKITSIEEQSTSATTNVDDKSVNKDDKNATKANYTVTNYYNDFKPMVFDSPEDIKTQQEWGGNCTLANWDDCKHLSTWFGKYFDPKDEEIKEYVIDCKLEPIVCLKNSWTVTRCNLLCMSRCNREISFKYEKYVIHNGECKAHAHG